MSPPSGRTPQIAGDEDFDALLFGGAEDLPEERADRATVRRWILVSASLALVGVLVIAVSIVIPPMVVPRPGADASGARELAAPSVTTTAPTPVPPRFPFRSKAETLPGVRTLPDKEWVASVAAATDIPARALEAYAGAAIEMSRTHPECSVGWNTLAAIGSVESEHGAIREATLSRSGIVSPPIFGEALTGARMDHIPDTDAGALDGDVVWDRAVGPMQFIPSSWAEWGTDAGGDGIADPQNIDDASLSAARYLCDVGGDFSVSQNWLDAVWAYNGTNDYVTRVSEAASAYATAMSVQ